MRTLQIPRVLLATVCLMLTASLSIAQNVTTVSDGDWNTPGIWSTGVVPSAATANTITVAHNVTITLAGVTIDETIVSGVGSLTVSDGISVTVNNGTGPDLIVDGTITMLGESFLTGAGNIIVNGRGVFGSLEPTGAIAPGTTLGNIRLATRRFNPGATIVYGGAAAQAIGSGHPTTSGVNCEINNASGVSLNNIVSATVTIGGDLNMLSGDLSVTNNNIRVSGSVNIAAGNLDFVSAGTARTLTVTTDLTTSGGTLSITSGAATATATITGNLNLNSGNIIISSGATNASLTLNGNITGSAQINATGANSNVNINGSGALTNSFPFATGAVLEQLLVNRPGGTVTFTRTVDFKNLRVTAGDVALGINTSFSGDVNITTGSTLTFSGFALTMQARFNNSLTGGLLAANSSSTLNLTGSGTVGTLAFAGGSNTLGTLTLNRPTTGTLVTLNSALTIQSAFNLTDGTFANTSGLTMANGATITRDAGASMTGVAPAGGPYNVVYTGTSNLTTGLEANGTVTNVTSNNTANVTIGAGGLGISGILDIEAGQMTCGTVSVTAASLLNNATFTAPSTSLTLTGNLTNNGTFNRNSGTVVFNGNSTINGTTLPTFFSITVSGTLTTSTLNLDGNFTNNGTFSGGTGTITFIGNSTQTVSGSSNSQFYDVVINKGPSTTVNVTGPTTINNSLTMTSGRINNATSQLAMANSATLSRASNTSLLGAAPTGGPYNLTYTGNGVITTSLEAQGSLNNVTNNAPSIVTIANPLSIPGTFSMNAGTISNPSNLITMGNGANVVRHSSATLTAFAPKGGPYNLTYTGTSLSTGLEAQGSLNDINITVSGTVTQATALTAAGTLTVTTGTYTGGANTLSIANVTNDATLNAPSTTLTLTGNFVNNGTFSHNNGTVVFNGTSSVSGTSTPLFNLVTIAGTFNNGSNTLNLAGHLTINGTLNGQTGTVQFSGSSVQNILGSATATFNNIRVSNSAGVSVETDKNLQGVLTLDNGTSFDADGSGGTAVFTLVSTDDAPDATGAIGPLSGGAVVNGSVNVQRFMSAKGVINRYISSPVSGAIASDLSDDFSILAMKWYQESVTGNINQGYHAVGVNEVLVVGRGYLVSPTNGAANITWDLRDPVNQGAINLNVTQTPSTPPNANNDGWNLVGNPYPAGIIWDNGAGWTKANIAPIIYVPDIQNNVSRTWNANTQTGDLPNGIITMGQAFWVYANPGGGPSLIVNEAAKVTGTSSTFFRRGNSGAEGMEIALSQGNVTDRSYFLIRNDATHGFDVNLDGYKLDGEWMAVSMVDAEGRKLVSSAVPALDEFTEIPLALYCPTSGSYSLSFPQIGSFGGYERLYLVDLNDGRSEKLTDITKFEFTAMSGSPSIANRFVLTTDPAQTLKSHEITIQVNTWPVPVTNFMNIEVSRSDVREGLLLNGMGQFVSRIEMTPELGVSRGTVDMTSLPTGLYIVRIQSAQGAVTKKILKK